MKKTDLAVKPRFEILGGRRGVAVVLFGSYATLKVYDLPVRAWLGKFNKS